MKKSGKFKKGVRYWWVFGVTLFAVMTLLDLITGQEIVWSEHILIPLLTVMLASFFDWAWDSKEYGKK
ncbi:hypothetical protein [Jeotgalibacillus haloalkalitolerans]|uniref:Holin n=1 Tax=Jeotgalibacillus haloalkalitolerans TaxID=3104292 RepID=A0ABU5KK01_9BACL|nr:hypothetical protein [Jeotgalibacillus sp. HH7-29]MDZ5711045.1 hypothetical protein [Jeotgalibacillus sp. HH7-29]